MPGLSMEWTVPARFTNVVQATSMQPKPCFSHLIYVALKRGRSASTGAVEVVEACRGAATSLISGKTNNCQRTVTTRCVINARPSSPPLPQGG